MQKNCNLSTFDPKTLVQKKQDSITNLPFIAIREVFIRIQGLTDSRSYVDILAVLSVVTD
jgi:hypothetical protein